MLQETIRLAAKEGIALVAGDYRQVPLTEQTLKNLSFGTGTRPDTTRVKILARLSVGERFARFGRI
jgi:hypothetical protein